MHISKNKYLSKLCAPLISSAQWLGKNYPETLVKIRYYVRFHKRLDLESPKDLNEKILWLSLRSDTSLWSACADKYAVRKYVEEKGLSDMLVKLYGVYDRAEDIDWEALPDAFVLKTVHGSGDIKVVTDKKKADRQALIDYFSQQLKHPYGYLEGSTHYPRIKPRLIAEEILHNDDASAAVSTSIIDYKIWCFNGRAYYCLVCTNRDKHGFSRMVYDRDWQPHPEYIVCSTEHKQGAVIHCPENWGQMLDDAEILADDFPCVRVDLYNIGGKIYFGELTFTSLGGLMNNYSKEFLSKCGELVKLPNQA